MDYYRHSVFYRSAPTICLGLSHTYTQAAKHAICFCPLFLVFVIQFLLKITLKFLYFTCSVFSPLIFGPLFSYLVSVKSSILLFPSSRLSSRKLMLFVDIHNQGLCELPWGFWAFLHCNKSACQLLCTCLVSEYSSGVFFFVVLHSSLVKSMGPAPGSL